MVYSINIPLQSNPSNTTPPVKPLSQEQEQVPSFSVSESEHTAGVTVELPQFSGPLSEHSGLPLEHQNYYHYIQNLIMQLSNIIINAAWELVCLTKCT